MHMISCLKKATVCRYFSRRLMKHGCKPKKVKVQYSAINCNFFHLKSGEFFLMALLKLQLQVS